MSLIEEEIMRFFLFSLLLFSSVQIYSAPILKEDRIEFPVPKLGVLEIFWPGYRAESDERMLSPKIVEKGEHHAVLRFPDGDLPDVKITLQNDIIRLEYGSGRTGTLHIRLTFPQRPGRNFSWRVPGKQMDFRPLPAVLQEKHHIWRGRASGFEFAEEDIRNVVVTWSRESYCELQDNRKWNWPVFQLDIFRPVPKKGKRDSLEIHFQAAESKMLRSRKGPVCDRFGQSMKVEWPGKVHRDEELKADLTSDRAYYRSFTPLATDAFGGKLDREIHWNAGGFFKLGKYNGHDIFISPDGNPFFQLAVCTVAPCDDYTYVRGREDLYQELPSREAPFDKAWMNPDVVSFYIANYIRKTGTPFCLAAWKRDVVYRLRQWGFNSQGAFRDTPELNRKLQFPYCPELPFQGVPCFIADVFDPFSPDVREAIDRNFRRLKRDASNPVIIGYFSGNERKYSEVAARLLACDGNVAARRELVRFLKERYQGDVERFSAAWNLPIRNFAELEKIHPDLKTPAAWNDLNEFMDHFFDTYFKLIHDTFRKYDRNHLLLGARFLPGQTRVEAAVRAAGKYNDVCSRNYYSYEIENHFLERIHRLSGVPLLLSEWHFGSTEQGLAGAIRPVRNQRERALHYRHYVEQAAALPFVVGIQWFSLLDQALTGRWFQKYQGENMNIGFLNVADRPYRELAAAAAETNGRVYDIIAGKIEPFSRVSGLVRTARQPKKTFIPRAVEGHKVDGIRSPWPGRPAERLGRLDLVHGDSASVSADFWLCYDQDFLYLYADVADSTPGMNPFSPALFWQGDAVELFFGPNEITKDGQLRFGDCQLLLSAGGNGRGYWCNRREQPPVKRVVRIWTDRKGYTMEAAIPWQALGIKPENGTEFRFDLGLDNFDGKQPQKCQLMWSGTGRNSEDRTNWGTAVLVD